MAIIYKLISFNTNDYDENRIEKELNDFVIKENVKNYRIVSMNLLKNGWTRFLFEVQQ